MFVQIDEKILPNNNNKLIMFKYFNNLVVTSR